MISELFDRQTGSKRANFQILRILKAAGEICASGTGFLGRSPAQRALKRASGIDKMCKPVAVPEEPLTFSDNEIANLTGIRASEVRQMSECDQDNSSWDVLSFGAARESFSGINEEAILQVSRDQSPYVLFRIKEETGENTALMFKLETQTPVINLADVRDRKDIPPDVHEYVFVKASHVCPDGRYTDMTKSLMDSPDLIKNVLFRFGMARIRSMTEEPEESKPVPEPRTAKPAHLKLVRS